jgi:hypothetical protein
LPEKSVFVDQIFESLLIEVETGPKSKCIVGTTYRPGSKHPTLSSSEQFNQFFELFSNLCSEVSEFNNPTYIFGDLNLDALLYNNSQQVTEYIDLLFSFGLLQIITKPTRVTLNSATLIDHLITNSQAKSLESVILMSKMSDHFPIIFLEKKISQNSSSEFFEARNFSQQNVNDFKILLAMTDWGAVLSSDCTQEAYNNFQNIFFNLYDTHFPVLRHKFNKNFHKLEKWMSSGLLVSRREKIRLCKLSLSIPNAENLARFKNYRNVYNKAVRTAKKVYFESELAANQTNLKKSWQLLKSAINKKVIKSPRIKTINANGKITEDPKEMATLFNEFFTSMPANIVKDLHPTDQEFCPDFAQSFFKPQTENAEDRPQFTLAAIPITGTEIMAAVNELAPKTSLDHNGVSMAFIKQCINNLLPSLQHIFQCSLE